MQQPVHIVIYTWEKLYYYDCYSIYEWCFSLVSNFVNNQMNYVYFIHFPNIYT